MEKGQLSQKLSTFGLAIEYLFTRSPIPLDRIENKLSQLDMVLSFEIPDNSRLALEVAREWRPKLAKYRELLAFALMSPDENGGHSSKKIEETINSTCVSSLPLKSLGNGIVDMMPSTNIHLKTESKLEDCMAKLSIIPEEEIMISTTRTMTPTSNLHLNCNLDDFFGCDDSKFNSKRSSPSANFLITFSDDENDNKQKDAVFEAPEDVHKKDNLILGCRKFGKEGISKGAKVDRNYRLSAKSNSEFYDFNFDNDTGTITHTARPCTSPSRSVSNRNSFPNSQIDRRINRRGRGRGGALRTNSLKKPLVKINPNWKYLVHASMSPSKSPSKLASVKLNEEDKHSRDLPVALIYTPPTSPADSKPPILKHFSPPSQLTSPSTKKKPISCASSHSITSNSSTLYSYQIDNFYRIPDSIPSIRNHLDGIFSQFNTITRASDLPAMKTLIVMMAKAAKMILPYLSDQELHNRVFEFAFCKLPLGKREQYDKMYSKKSLRKLILFMRHHIIYLSDLEADRRLLVAKNQFNISKVACNYCKLPGHGYQACDVLKESICFKCFEYGHTIKTCQDAPLLSLDWINFDILDEKDQGTFTMARFSVETFKEEANLHQKLNVLAFVLEKLMSLKTVSTETVGQKLNQLEQMILEVDECRFPKLVHEWKQKLSGYWDMLIPTRDGEDFSRFNKLASPSRSSSSVKSSPRSPTILRSYLVHMFNQFPPIIQPDDSHSLKQLAILVAQATKLIFPSDEFGPFAESLQSTVFDLAFQKLPPTKQSLFNFYRHYKRSLRSLIHFLRYCLIAEHEKSKRMSAVQPKPVSPLSDQVVQFCKYCKLDGHDFNNCPTISEVLCFKCFQLGHTNKTCQNEPMVDLDWLNGTPNEEGH